VRRRIVACALLALLAAGSAPHAGQPADAVTLAWDASRGLTTGYRVHVGTESRLYDQSYDVGRATSFVFDGPSWGTRSFFAVTAYDADGRESPFSNEISYLFGDEPEPPVIAQRPDSPVAREHRLARVRADALGPVSGIAALPDGRVLFVEDARQVRMIDTVGLVAAPSLTTDAPDTAFTEVVIDPSFDRTSFVFVGTTQRQRDGRQDFRIVRYRLVGDSLGEGATLVGNLALAGEHAPRFTVDNMGRIYVAVPGAAAARGDMYAGRLLRFAPDGSVPDDHRGLSPVLAHGLAVPRDLDWDGQAVWVVGLDDRAQPALGRLVPDAADGEWPRRLSAAGFAIPPDLEVSAFDATASIAAGRSPEAVIVDLRQRLHRVITRAPENVSEVEALDGLVEGLPVEVALGPHGAIHVVIRTATGRFAIVEIPDH
jgi:hypothetical protein